MRVFVVTLFVTFMAGCAALAPRLQTPHLSIVNIEMLDGNLMEQRVRVRMRVQNPNDRTLPVKGLTYALEVNGEDLARGVSDESFVVPALGETEFAMTIRTNAALTLLRFLGRGSSAATDAVKYRLHGKVSLSEGLLRSIPFEEEGVFSLK